MMERIPPRPSERLDRENELLFYYRGRPMKGLAGDTVATALFANGERIFSRSLKYHRPRGLYNLDGYSAHCLMSVNGEPNVLACIRPLEPNMVVEPQNVVGSPGWDLLSVFQWFHFAMPAGFVYRTFHKPSWIWPFAQKMLRRAAGLGKIDPHSPDGVYENKYLNAEVCVIGGGAAGMSAALAAADAGARVILIEGREYLGGSLNYRLLAVHDHVPAHLHAARVADEISARENIRVLLSTSATSIYQSNHVTAVQRGGPADHFRLRYYEIRAGSVVVATGGIERPLIFQNNDCPGIMQGSCAQQLVNRYGLKPGEKAVISGCHNGLLEVASDLSEAGVEVLAVADARKEGFDQEAVKRLDRLGIPFLPGYVVSGARRFRTLKGVVIQAIEGSDRLGYDCDLLVASAGETPLSQLLQVAGAAMVYDPYTAQFLPKELPPGVHAGGRILGLHDTKAIKVQGRMAGLEALQDLGVDVETALKRAKDELSFLPGAGAGLNLVNTPGRGYHRYVSFDEDVTVKQVEQAVDDGFYQAELVKRYTAAGTGPSQSYLSGYNLALLVSEKRALKPGEIPPTTVRPPVVATSLAVLGGRQYHPVKHTPIRAQQAALGASFRLAGEWERARHFNDEKILDEVMSVRNNVGFIDISTLGKFRIHGPDALKLLQRVYVNDMSRVSQRRLTYSVMCNEEGVVIDDGVVTKLGENDYFFTTSTLRAAYTPEWLRYHGKDEDWQAYVVNLTDALAAINLAGPKAREVLSSLTDQDVSNGALPFMGFLRMTLCGDIPAMIARIGFVGEICYEIHVPSSYGPALHDAILEAGRSFHIKPFGLEAQSIMRLEKGHVIIVVDTDNHTTLHEIGIGKIWARNKTDAKTVGVPALRFAESQIHREKLVGFMMAESNETPPDGSIVVDRGVIKGRVCTSRYSPTLKKSIGMALIEPDLAVMGGTFEIYTDGKMVKKRVPEIKTVTAKIVPMPFYDPKGERIRG
ncbi:MAG: 2Fe-2S iron-sulfur cluster-binding protein [Pseudomonadota bacterium]